MGNKRLFVMLFAVVTSLSGEFGGSAAAQSLPTTILEPVIVSSSRIPTSLSDAPETVTVMTREDIEAQQSTSAIDILRQIPGLHIDQPGGKGGVSSVYIRGSDPNFTVVLIDGIKVNDPTNSRGGSFDFSTLDPESIERIEIVRGPLSSVYGSEAMGGVINIVTRQGTGTPAVTIDSSGGLHGYARTGLSASGPVGPANFAVNFAYVDDGSPVKGSEFTSKSVNAKLTLPVSHSMWLHLVSRYADSQAESFPDDSGGPQFAVRRAVDRRDSQEFTIGAEFGHELLPWWEYTLKASFYDRQETVSSPGVAPGLRDPFGIPPNSGETDFRRTTVTGSSLFSLSSTLRATVGVDLQLERGDSDTELLFGDKPAPSRFTLDRIVYAPFGEIQYTLPFGGTLGSGLRLDVPENFATRVSPRIGILYPIPATQTTLKANWGKGFKLPSFFALGNAIVGNPRLRPETSEGIDAGVVQKLWIQRASISATFFHNRFFNLIDFDPGPPPQLVNRSEVTTQGVELGLTIEPSNALWINAHLTYLDTDIKRTSQKLRHRPPWQGGINVRWYPLPTLVCNFDALYVGHMFDSSIPTGDHTLEDYLRVDVATAWTITPHWQVSLAINNLFDTKYEEAVGFPSPGIIPHLTTRFTF